ncbi:TIGR03943 family putative permease subunit [Heyndrickxia acidiproducens]|uniref:TIGR03943 family putative permease subunit n=1 Tax=Heyndrickxia acidiproducens TaxID=1121084 RepID=UPI00036282FE|nr:TIGR03943 family protein [Heyndrickxia acidiproducens]
MLRFIVLFGFAYFFMKLHATGDISKYINMKYSFLSFSMIFVMFFLMIYQLVKWVRAGNKEEHHVHHGHSHEQDENTWYKKVFTYGLILIPVVTGIFLPVATLNSTVVKAKGFHFSMIDNDKDQYANHQILRPNSSLYYDKNQYVEMENSDLKQYRNLSHITLDDNHYFHGLETIYNYPGNFIGKKVTIKGFVYRTDDIKDNQLFVLRFGIIHCIADAGVYGMLVDFPDHMKNKLKENTWIQVSGTLSTTYYDAFKENIPYLTVTDYQKIPEPKDPYVYRQYN